MLNAAKSSALNYSSDLSFKEYAKDSGVAPLSSVENRIALHTLRWFY